MSLSIWEKESFYAPCDTIIVGSGLLGLWTARELKIKRPSQKVTLIDQFPLPSGASVRNAGFACFGSPSELIHDLQLMGENAMWSLVEMRFRGMQKIRKVFSDAEIGLENNGGYECYLVGKDHAIREQLDNLNAGMYAITGEQQVFKFVNSKLDEYALTGFNSMAANLLEAGLHSGKLVTALMNEVKSLGVQLIFGMEYKQHQILANEIAIEAVSKNVRMFNIQAQQIVFTTNAWLSQQYPQLHIAPARGQVILSPPIAGLPLSGTFHFDEGYYYFRNLDNRLLLGGARNADFDTEHTLMMGNTALITDTLYSFIQNHIPAAAHIPAGFFQHWSGIMAMHGNKQPLLQEVEPGIWAAMCCNGMGVALSPVFAEQVVAALINA